MMRDLQKRLARLERNRPPRQTEEEESANRLFGFMVTAIGYYLGDPTPKEAPIAAYGRALGYTQKEVFDALNLAVREGSNLELRERHASARNKLFAKFSFEWDEADFTDDTVWHEFIEILKRMHAGMSERYKDLAERDIKFD